MAPVVGPFSRSTALRPASRAKPIARRSFEPSTMRYGKASPPSTYILPQALPTCHRPTFIGCCRPSGASTHSTLTTIPTASTTSARLRLAAKFARAIVATAAAFIVSTNPAPAFARDLDDVGRAFTEGEEEYGVTIRCLVTLEAATGGTVSPNMSGVDVTPQVWTLTEVEEAIQVNDKFIGNAKRLADGRLQAV